MILHPPVLALMIGSILTSFLLLYAAAYGVSILRRWDLKSGSEMQLGLERKTYLISTMVSYAFGFQLLSLFLFIYTADDLCRLFTGAMCAAGTLFVNAYGYPTLVYKIVTFLGAGVWLILNHVDNRAYDYPLIRSKYAMLLFLTPLLIMETILQFVYFNLMKPNIITSCCGSLFSVEQAGISSTLAAFSGMGMRVTFFACMGLTLLLAWRVYRSAGKGGLLYSVMCGATFVVSLLALISFFSLYYYELPTHHCPFCILQREYGYTGYLLYLALFGGAVYGMGVGAIAFFRKTASLATIIPAVQRKLAVASAACYGFFTVMVTWKMVFSNLRM